MQKNVITSCRCLGSISHMTDSMCSSSDSASVALGLCIHTDRNILRFPVLCSVPPGKWWDNSTPATTTSFHILLNSWIAAHTGLAEPLTWSLHEIEQHISILVILASKTTYLSFCS
jgi:hypothetical protein